MCIDFSHQTQLWLGLQEKELTPWFRSLSTGIRTAIDAGAAQGTYVLYFLSKTSAQRVLAFEPSGDSVAAMKRNLQLNELETDGRLEIVCKFAGSQVKQGTPRLTRFRVPFRLRA